MPIVNDLLDAKKVLSARLLGASVRVRGKGLRSFTTMAEAAAAAGNNVHAVGIGKKTVDGKVTDTDCVRLFVVQKIASSAMAPRDLLPAQLAGIPTDIVEAPLALLGGSGAIAATGNCSDLRKQRQRPVIGGISVGHPDVTAGTLAYFCQSTRAGDDPSVVHVLSNNHIFANLGRGNVGDPLYQPGSIDGGTSADIFATLERWEDLQLDGTTPNLIDGAIGAMAAGVSHTLEVCSIGTITGTAQATGLMGIRKHGRTSGYTEGTVTDVLIDALVGMDPYDPSALGFFQNQMRLEPTTSHPAIGFQGDSGSLIVDGASQTAVGLYFANPQSGEYAYANHIADVMSHLEITLL
jgi:hypothetical protein